MDGLEENKEHVLVRETVGDQKRYVSPPRMGGTILGEDCHTAGAALLSSMPDTSIPMGRRTETASASAKNISIVNSSLCVRCKG